MSSRLIETVTFVALMCMVISDVTPCKVFWHNNATIINKVTKNYVTANTSDANAVIKDNTVVKLHCVDDSKQINGSDIIKCVNGIWNHPIPICAIKQHSNKSLSWKIIGSSVGGGVLLIIIITLISVCYCQRRRKTDKRTEESTNKVPNLSMGLRNSDTNLPNGFRNSDMLTNNVQSRHMSNRRENEYSEHMYQHDSRYASAGSMNIYRNSDGISMIGSSASILGTSNIPIFKVWTCRRTRRKFIKAENLAALARKASAIYQYDNPVRFTLEEDGTEIDSDEALASCAGKTLVVLSEYEQWSDRHGNTNVQLQKFTFDVCSYDRKIRKLILATGLKDLIYQAPTSFGYDVNVICLESDGTYIDDDDSLISMSNQLLMALGKAHTWTVQYEPIKEVEKIENDIPANERIAYKVWSEDGHQKKILKAENCIDLHIKASRALGLEMPIQIHVKDNDTIISTDILLQMNADNIFVATPGYVPQGVMNNPNSHTYVDNGYQDRYISNDNPVQATIEERGNVLSSGNKEPNAGYAFGKASPKPQETDIFKVNRNNRGMSETHQTVLYTNHPDVVKSSQGTSLLPSRYGPHDTSVHIQQKMHQTDPEKGEINQELRDANTFRHRNEDQTSVSSKRFHELDNQSSEPYTSIYPSNLSSKKSEQISSDPYRNPSNFPNFNLGLTNNKFSQQKSSFKRNETELPYSSLEPAHKKVVEENTGSNRDEIDLPYSSLEPVHKRFSQQKNNFDVMRQQQGNERSRPDYNKSHDDDTEKEVFKPSLFRQSSFLVTGGARQNRDSDVLF